MRHKLGRDYAHELSFQIKAARLPAPIREFPFAKPQRAFRADLAFPALRLLVEVDGSVHRIKERFRGDLERDQWIFLNLPTWRKLRVSPRQVRSGEALQLVERALALAPLQPPA